MREKKAGEKPAKNQKLESEYVKVLTGFALPDPPLPGPNDSGRFILRTFTTYSAYGTIQRVRESECRTGRMS